MKKILFFILCSAASCLCQQTNDTRCYIGDEECEKNFFQSVAGTYAVTGIEQIGIPVIDPLAIKNEIMSILGLETLTLLEGVAEGITTCVVTKLESNVEGRYRRPEMICSKITIRGRYKLTPTPVMGNICGWCNIHGEGNGSIVLEDWGFKFNYSYRFEKRENGKIYLVPLFDKAVYETSVKKVTVNADCIKSGETDITHNVISFINNNWKTLWNSDIGKCMNDKSAQYYYDLYATFYNKISAKTFLKNNLEQYL